VAVFTFKCLTLPPSANHKRFLMEQPVRPIHLETEPDSRFRDNLKRLNDSLWSMNSSPYIYIFSRIEGVVQTPHAEKSKKRENLVKSEFNGFVPLIIAVTIFEYAIIIVKITKTF
jgi:hypothetical protein